MTTESAIPETSFEQNTKEEFELRCKKSDTIVSDLKTSDKEKSEEKTEILGPDKNAEKASSKESKSPEDQTLSSTSSGATESTSYIDPVASEDPQKVVDGYNPCATADPDIDQISMKTEDDSKGESFANSPAKIEVDSEETRKCSSENNEKQMIDKAKVENPTAEIPLAEVSCLSCDAGENRENVITIEGEKFRMKAKMDEPVEKFQSIELNKDAERETLNAEKITEEKHQPAISSEGEKLGEISEFVIQDQSRKTVDTVQNIHDKIPKKEASITNYFNGDLLVKETTVEANLLTGKETGKELEKAIDSVSKEQKNFDEKEKLQKGVLHKEEISGMNTDNQYVSQGPVDMSPQKYQTEPQNTDLSELVFEKEILEVGCNDKSIEKEKIENIANLNHGESSGSLFGHPSLEEEKTQDQNFESLQNLESSSHSPTIATESLQKDELGEKVEKVSDLALEEKNLGIINPTEDVETEVYEVLEPSGLVSVEQEIENKDPEEKPDKNFGSSTSTITVNPNIQNNDVKSKKLGEETEETSSLASEGQNLEKNNKTVQIEKENGGKNNGELSISKITTDSNIEDGETKLENSEQACESEENKTSHSVPVHKEIDESEKSPKEENPNENPVALLVSKGSVAERPAKNTNKPVSKEKNFKTDTARGIADSEIPKDKNQYEETYPVFLTKMLAGTSSQKGKAEATNLKLDITEKMSSQKKEKESKKLDTVYENETEEPGKRKIHESDNKCEKNLQKEDTGKETKHEKQVSASDTVSGIGVVEAISEIEIPRAKLNKLSGLVSKEKGFEILISSSFDIQKTEETPVDKEETVGEMLGVVSEAVSNDYHEIDESGNTGKESADEEKSKKNLDAEPVTEVQIQESSGKESEKLEKVASSVFEDQDIKEKTETETNRSETAEVTQLGENLEVLEFSSEEQGFEINDSDEKVENKIIINKDASVDVSSVEAKIEETCKQKYEIESTKLENVSEIENAGEDSPNLEELEKKCIEAVPEIQAQIEESSERDAVEEENNNVKLERSVGEASEDRGNETSAETERKITEIPKKENDNGSVTEETGRTSLQEEETEGKKSKKASEFEIQDSSNVAETTEGTCSHQEETTSLQRKKGEIEESEHGIPTKEIDNGSITEETGRKSLRKEETEGEKPDNASEFEIQDSSIVSETTEQTCSHPEEIARLLGNKGESEESKSEILEKDHELEFEKKICATVIATENREGETSKKEISEEDLQEEETEGGKLEIASDFMSEKEIKGIDKTLCSVSVGEEMIEEILNKEEKQCVKIEAVAPEFVPEEQSFERIRPNEEIETKLQNEEIRDKNVDEIDNVVESLRREEPKKKKLDTVPVMQIQIEESFEQYAVEKQKENVSLERSFDAAMEHQCVETITETENRDKNDGNLSISKITAGSNIEYGETKFENNEKACESKENEISNSVHVLTEIDKNEKSPKEENPIENHDALLVSKESIEESSEKNTNKSFQSLSKEKNFETDASMEIADTNIPKDENPHKETDPLFLTKMPAETSLQKAKAEASNLNLDITEDTYSQKEETKNKKLNTVNEIKTEKPEKRKIHERDNKCKENPQKEEIGKEPEHEEPISASDISGIGVVEAISENEISGEKLNELSGLVSKEKGLETMITSYFDTQKTEETVVDKEETVGEMLGVVSETVSDDYHELDASENTVKERADEEKSNKKLDAEPVTEVQIQESVGKESEKLERVASSVVKDQDIKAKTETDTNRNEIAEVTQLGEILEVLEFLSEEQGFKINDSDEKAENKILITKDASVDVSFVEEKIEETCKQKVEIESTELENVSEIENVGEDSPNGEELEKKCVEAVPELQAQIKESSERDTVEEENENIKLERSVGEASEDQGNEISAETERKITEIPKKEINNGSVTEETRTSLQEEKEDEKPEKASEFEIHDSSDVAETTEGTCSHNEETSLQGNKAETEESEGGIPNKKIDNGSVTEETGRKSLRQEETEGEKPEKASEFEIQDSSIVSETTELTCSHPEEIARLQGNKGETEESIHEILEKDHELEFQEKISGTVVATENREAETPKKKISETELQEEETGEKLEIASDFMSKKEIEGTDKTLCSVSVGEEMIEESLNKEEKQSAINKEEKQSAKIGEVAPEFVPEEQIFERISPNEEIETKLQNEEIRDKNVDEIDNVVESLRGEEPTKEELDTVPVMQIQIEETFERYTVEKEKENPRLERSFDAILEHQCVETITEIETKITKVPDDDIKYFGDSSISIITEDPNIKNNDVKSKKLGEETEESSTSASEEQNVKKISTKVQIEKENGDKNDGDLSISKITAGSIIEYCETKLKNSEKTCESKENETSNSVHVLKEIDESEKSPKEENPNENPDALLVSKGSIEKSSEKNTNKSFESLSKERNFETDGTRGIADTDIPKDDDPHKETDPLFLTKMPTETSSQIAKAEASNLNLDITEDTYSQKEETKSKKLNAVYEIKTEKPENRKIHESDNKCKENPQKEETGKETEYEEPISASDTVSGIGVVERIFETEISREKLNELSGLVLKEKGLEMLVSSSFDTQKKEETSVDKEETVGEMLGVVSEAVSDDYHEIDESENTSKERAEKEKSNKKLDAEPVTEVQIQESLGKEPKKPEKRKIHESDNKSKENPQKEETRKETEHEEPINASDTVSGIGVVEATSETEISREKLNEHSGLVSKEKGLQTLISSSFDTQKTEETSVDKEEMVGEMLGVASEAVSDDYHEVDETENTGKERADEEKSNKKLDAETVTEAQIQESLSKESENLERGASSVVKDQDIKAKTETETNRSEIAEVTHLGENLKVLEFLSEEQGFEINDSDEKVENNIIITKDARVNISFVEEKIEETCIQKDKIENTKLENVSEIENVGKDSPNGEELVKECVETVPGIQAQIEESSERGTVEEENEIGKLERSVGEASEDQGNEISAETERKITEMPKKEIDNGSVTEETGRTSLQEEETEGEKPGKASEFEIQDSSNVAETTEGTCSRQEETDSLQRNKGETEESELETPKKEIDNGSVTEETEGEKASEFEIQDSSIVAKTTERTSSHPEEIARLQGYKGESEESKREILEKDHELEFGEKISATVVATENREAETPKKEISDTDLPIEETEGGKLAIASDFVSEKEIEGIDKNLCSVSVGEEMIEESLKKEEKQSVKIEEVTTELVSEEQIFERVHPNEEIETRLQKEIWDKNVDEIDNVVEDSLSAQPVKENLHTVPVAQIQIEDSIEQYTVEGEKENVSLERSFDVVLEHPCVETITETETKIIEVPDDDIDIGSFTEETARTSMQEEETVNEKLEKALQSEIKENPDEETQQGIVSIGFDTKERAGERLRKVEVEQMEPVKDQTQDEHLDSSIVAETTDETYSHKEESVSSGRDKGETEELEREMLEEDHELDTGNKYSETVVATKNRDSETLKKGETPEMGFQKEETEGGTLQIAPDLASGKEIAGIDKKFGSVAVGEEIIDGCSKKEENESKTEEATSGLVTEENIYPKPSTNEDTEIKLRDKENPEMDHHEIQNDSKDSSVMEENLGRSFNRIEPRKEIVETGSNGEEPAKGNLNTGSNKEENLDIASKGEEPREENLVMGSNREEPREENLVTGLNREESMDNLDTGSKAEEPTKEILDTCSIGEETMTESIDKCSNREEPAKETLDIGLIGEETKKGSLVTGSIGEEATKENLAPGSKSGRPEKEILDTGSKAEGPAKEILDTYSIEEETMKESIHKCSNKEEPAKGNLDTGSIREETMKENLGTDSKEPMKETLDTGSKAEEAANENLDTGLIGEETMKESFDKWSDREEPAKKNLDTGSNIEEPTKANLDTSSIREETMKESLDTGSIREEIVKENLDSGSKEPMKETLDTTLKAKHMKETLDTGSEAEESAKEILCTCSSREETMKEIFDKCAKREEPEKENLDTGSNMEPTMENLHTGSIGEDTMKERFDKGMTEEESTEENLDTGSNRKEPTKENLDTGSNREEPMKGNLNNGTNRKEAMKENLDIGSNGEESAKEILVLIREETVEDNHDTGSIGEEIVKENLDTGSHAKEPTKGNVDMRSNPEEPEKESFDGGSNGEGPTKGNHDMGSSPEESRKENFDTGSKREEPMKDSLETGSNREEPRKENLGTGSNREPAKEKLDPMAMTQVQTMESFEKDTVEEETGKTEFERLHNPVTEYQGLETNIEARTDITGIPNDKIDNKSATKETAKTSLQEGEAENEKTEKALNFEITVEENLDVLSVKDVSVEKNKQLGEQEKVAKEMAQTSIAEERTESGESEKASGTVSDEQTHEWNPDANLDPSTVTETLQKEESEKLQEASDSVSRKEMHEKSDANENIENGKSRDKEKKSLQATAEHEIECPEKLPRSSDLESKEWSCDKIDETGNGEIVTIENEENPNKNCNDLSIPEARFEETTLKEHREVCDFVSAKGIPETQTAVEMATQETEFKVEKLENDSNAASDEKVYEDENIDISILKMDENPSENLDVLSVLQEGEKHKETPNLGFEEQVLEKFDANKETELEIALDEKNPCPELFTEAAVNVGKREEETEIEKLQTAPNLLAEEQVLEMINTNEKSESGIPTNKENPNFSSIREAKTERSVPEVEPEDPKQLGKNSNLVLAEQAVQSIEETVEETMQKKGDVKLKIFSDLASEEEIDKTTDANDSTTPEGRLASEMLEKDSGSIACNKILETIYASTSEETETPKDDEKTVCLKLENASDLVSGEQSEVKTNNRNSREIAILVNKKSPQIKFDSCQEQIQEIMDPNSEATFESKCEASRLEDTTAAKDLKEETLQKQLPSLTSEQAHAEEIPLEEKINAEKHDKEPAATFKKQSPKVTDPIEETETKITMEEEKQDGRTEKLVGTEIVAEDLNEESKVSDSDKVRLSDLLQEYSSMTLQTAEKSMQEKNLTIDEEKLQNNQQLTVLAGDKTDEEKKAEKEWSSEAPLMVETSRDADTKPVQKKSHNILSSVGSKVKHSIVKVKKAITGKSSHSNTVPPK